MKIYRVKILSNGAVELYLWKDYIIYTNFITKKQRLGACTEYLFGENGLVFKGIQINTIEKNRTKCYNAGKISGLTKKCSEANFYVADQYILSAGYKPINPLKSGLSEYAPYWLHMFVDLCLLASCKAVYFQENWKDSRGAKIEHKFATFLGKDILYQKY